MAKNETSAFLGRSYSWSKTRFKLHDVQALHGGIRIYVHSWGPAFVTHVAAGGQETKYKIPLGRDEKEQLCQLCIEQDFVTIAPENRPGIPDEARSSITVINYKGREHTVAKWAGVEDKRFDAVYAALRQLDARTQGMKPVVGRLRPYQKTLVILGLILLIPGLLLLASRMASALVTNWGANYPGRLTAATILLMIGVIPALLGLRFHERKRPYHDRMSANLYFLGLLNLLVFVGAATLFSGFSLPFGYQQTTILLTATFTIYLLIFGAVLAGQAIFDFIDARF